MRAVQRLSRRLRRTAWQALPTVLGILILNFLLLQLAPGDAADAMIGESGGADSDMMAAFRRSFGLDLPVAEQLWRYLSNLAAFDLGMSTRLQLPVLDLIRERIPGTLLLVGLATAFAMVLGMVAGLVMAIRADGPVDRVLNGGMLLLYAMPTFWLGLVLVLVFALALGWLPSGGIWVIWDDDGSVGTWLRKVQYLVLPVATLALSQMALYARVMRTSVLEVMELDYVRTARAKGIGARKVLLRHVWRNSLLPITTLTGVQVGGLFGGAVVVETIFSWPGLGQLAYESVISRDFNVLLGILLISALLVILCNVVVDLTQAWLDPRTAG